MAPVAEDILIGIKEKEETKENKSKLAELAEEILGEDEETLEDSLFRLLSWLENQSHLKNSRTDRNFLLRFLRMQKHRVENSSQVLEKYLTMRTSHPLWFQNLDIRDPHLLELIQRGYIFALPERDLEGRRVIYSVARNMDPVKHSSSDAMRAHIMTFEALLEDEENQIRGFTYIFDCSGLTLSHLSIWTPQEVARILSICEKNLPMRHGAIHLLNLPFAMWAVLEFCKALLSSKIKKRFCVHSSFDKLVTKVGQILPEENGTGGGMPLNTMTALWAEELERKRESLLALDKMMVIQAENVRAKERRTSFWGFLTGAKTSED